MLKNGNARYAIKLSGIFRIITLIKHGMNTADYTKTLAYKAIESISSLTELNKRKHKVLEGIRYHREKDNQIQANLFLSQYEHIENRLKTF